MASGFPGSIDNFTDPLTTSALTSPSHAGQHQDLNDAVEKIETYMGLVKVIPTSVSSAGGTAATLSANGTVNVGTSNTSLVVNGAFSALYDVYLIVFNGIDFSGTNNVQFDFDDGTSVYNYAIMSMNYNSTTITGSRNQSQTSAVIGFGGTNNDTNISLTVRGPYLANRKSFSTQQNTDTYTLVGGGGQDATTQHTKFRLTTSGTSFTGGSIRVYGYRN